MGEPKKLIVSQGTLTWQIHQSLDGTSHKWVVWDAADEVIAKGSTTLGANDAMDSVVWHLTHQARKSLEDTDV
jgi:hypothetical protein